MLIVNDKKCYSYSYAQKCYNRFLESDDQLLKVLLYRFKNDLKPKYEFTIVKDKPLNKNLFLQILYMIELDIARHKRKLAEAKTKKEKQEEQEYLEMLKKAEKEKIVVGDGARLCYNTLTEQGITLKMAPEHLRMQSAWGVARAALELVRSGGLVSGEELAPVYCRLSQAERERLEREAKSK